MLQCATADQLGSLHFVFGDEGDRYIKPGVPHEVFNIGDEPLVAFVARSTADEWDKIVNYPSQHRPAE